MLRKETILTVFLTVTMLITISYRFYDYVIEKNIQLYTYASCNTEKETCFIVDEENAYYEFQTHPYKKVSILDAYAPACLEEHTCEEFKCDNLASCEITYCAEDTLEEGEYCVTSDSNSENESDNIGTIIE
jgi:hypothetical protein